MNNLTKIVKNNYIDYYKIRDNSYISLDKEKKYNINVIIGFKGRVEFIKPVLDSFKQAIKFYNKKFNLTKDKICITFVEHDDKPYNKDLLTDVSYIWTTGNTLEQYSRSFVYNFGVKFSNKSKFYLLHDLDILVKEDFFVELYENLKDSRCIQTYGNRRVLYLTRDLSENILNNNFNYNTLTEGIVNSAPNRDIPIPNIGSKGGSILIERNLFFDIGGYDPELFNGYAPEDQMFWEKATSIIGKIDFADNPPIDMFHMYHPLSESTNTKLDVMTNYMNEYNKLTNNEKDAFIKLKKNILKGIF